MKYKKAKKAGLLVTIGIAVILAFIVASSAQDGMMEDDKMEDGMMEDDKMEDDAKDNPGPFVGIVLGVLGILALARRRQRRA
jgi:MYXO-CTERM domain-containing protein